ncbi:MAG: glycosyltransferase family 4 protein, partial [Gammaproteobacteria bacterium]|nr:glycosyltransferase family 4 protein [Gammaproteobacteria bacterium]
FSKWHPFIMVMQWAENFAYKNADRVVSLLPSAKEHMISHGMTADKFVHIPNGSDISSLKSDESFPKEHSELIKKMKRRGKFIVGYLGGHNISNALQYLIMAAEIVKNQDEIHFILVGQGSKKETLKSLAKKLNLCNISFLPPIQKSAVSTLLVEMDVVYIGWRREPLYRFGVNPNKLIDYMMAAKPVIHSIDAGNDLVAESGCGISTMPENPQAIADAIYDLHKLPSETRIALGQKGRDYVTTHHDFTILANKFLEGL